MTTGGNPMKELVKLTMNIFPRNLLVPKKIPEGIPIADAMKMEITEIETEKPKISQISGLNVNISNNASENASFTMGHRHVHVEMSFDLKYSY
nr:hypothetical protein [Candidatus Sigynarchaeota archaeon]